MHGPRYHPGEVPPLRPAGEERAGDVGAVVRRDPADPAYVRVDLCVIEGHAGGRTEWAIHAGGVSLPVEVWEMMAQAFRYGLARGGHALVVCGDYYDGRPGE